MEKITIKDDLKVLDNYTNHKNFIKILDADTKEVLVSRRENLVVHRGRTFALEKLYNDSYNASPYPTNNLSRKINLFSVGTGGCNSGTPELAIPPTPLDTNLTTIIPFISSSSDNADHSIYPIATHEGSVYNYYYKRFEVIDPVWYLDRTSNTVYKKLELLVDVTDARDPGTISELGLFFSGNSDFSDPEMYSRVTFPTENISGSKRLQIEYYTYA
jgi:hypothetical protein